METSRKDEEKYLEKTLQIVKANVDSYESEIAVMQEDIDEMLEHYHNNDVEVYTALSNTVTLRDHMKRALERNMKAINKPYFGRIVFWDEHYNKEESLYIGRGGISKDTTHQIVVDWRAPVSNAYYENGLGKCAYPSSEGEEIAIDLKLKRTYEIDSGKLLDYFDTEVIANDDLLTKYLAKNKQAVLGEIIATIQKEQNEIIRKSPYHNMIVQGVAGSGKTTVAMHRISYILYNYQERFRPDDFYIVGSNRILLDYITGVLPDLDVYGIRQMTMEQLFTRLLYEDWDGKKYSIMENDQSTQRGCFRGSLFWFEDLCEYCRQLEKDTISTEAVYLNPKQFVEGIRDGAAGVFDETIGKEVSAKDLIEILSEEAVRDYVVQNPGVSVQAKINMLNERLLIRIKDEFLKKGLRYTEKERKAILKAYRGRYGKKVWGHSIFKLYQEFLFKQREKGYDVDFPEKEFDVYDLAALAYIYKRVKETEVISEAHHVVIDEAQDFGMMAYAVLDFCIKDCTYTIMGDVSQNIHFGYGLNDWEQLRTLLCDGERDSFGVLRKSYRNTVEISEFAMNILQHGQFAAYPAEPIIRHGNPVMLRQIESKKRLFEDAAQICKEWQKKGLNTIAVVCRSAESARDTARELSKLVPVSESDLEKAVFSDGIMVLPVAYTKGLEFDAVLIVDPDREEYPVDDGHAKLLYVAATRALHELCVLHTGNLTGLIADPVPVRMPDFLQEEEQSNTNVGTRVQEQPLAQPTVKPLAQPTVKPSVQPIVKPPVQPENLEVPVSRKKVAAVVRSPKPVKEPPKTVLLTGVKPIVPKPIMAKNIQKQQPDLLFGDMPVTEKLRPIGHSKIDLSVKWFSRQSDGLYLQSRYGILRICPVSDNIIRVTFAKEGQPVAEAKKGIALRQMENTWMYREANGQIELLGDEFCLQIEKTSGAIRYMNGEKKLLVAERSKECRQVDAGDKARSWLFLDWKREEQLYTPGTGGKAGFKLSGSARYLSAEKDSKEYPFLLSDKGYGILMATKQPVICCDIPTYGSYLSIEGDEQMDFYFITGKNQNDVISAYGKLLGK